MEKIKNKKVQSFFIKEEDYQNIKKKMNKNNDFFSEKELEKVVVILS